MIPRAGDGVLRFVHAGAGVEALVHQRFLARVCGLSQGQIIARAGQIGGVGANFSLQGDNAGLRGGELGIRLVDGDLERRRIDSEQHFARLDVLVLVHVD